jgi:predicted amidohydrolase YtcJ
MGKKSSEEMKSFITDGLNLCVKMGLTSVQTNDAESLSVYKELQNEDKLPVRVFLTPNYEELLVKGEEGILVFMSAADAIMHYIFRSFMSFYSCFFLDESLCFTYAYRE